MRQHYRALLVRAYPSDPRFRIARTTAQIHAALQVGRLRTVRARTHTHTQGCILINTYDMHIQMHALQWPYLDTGFQMTQNQILCNRQAGTIDCSPGFQQYLTQRDCSQYHANTHTRVTATLHSIRWVRVVVTTIDSMYLAPQTSASPVNQCPTHWWCHSYLGCSCAQSSVSYQLPRWCSKCSCTHTIQYHLVLLSELLERFVNVVALGLNVCDALLNVIQMQADLGRVQCNLRQLMPSQAQQLAAICGQYIVRRMLVAVIVRCADDDRECLKVQGQMSCCDLQWIQISDGATACSL
jgi:hypothetical protein